MSLQLRPLFLASLLLSFNFPTRGAEPTGGSTPAEAAVKEVLLPTELRSWTSSDGKIIKAKLLTVNAEMKTVSLELEGGKRMTSVPITRFSAEDQKFFATCREQSRQDGNGITSVSGENTEMNKAMEQARKTFPAAFEKIRKDNYRDEPLFSMVLVKAQFSDHPEKKMDDENVEHMWIGEFIFNGSEITGTLLSQPGKLKSVKEGDRVSVPLAHLTDWTYRLEGKVSGAFTEKLLHSRMTPAEKISHNEATGVDWDAQ